jgi:hypothetical protein
LARIFRTKRALARIHGSEDLGGFSKNRTTRLPLGVTHVRPMSNTALDGAIALNPGRSLLDRRSVDSHVGLSVKLKREPHLGDVGWNIVVSQNQSIARG